MPYANVETLLEFVKNNTPNINGETTMACVERAIKEAPTADVVEVVRCKDCKYFFKDFARQLWCRKTSDGLGINEEHIVAETHYCGYGERKVKQQCL